MMIILLLLLDLGFVESTHQAIGESGGEDSEDEWNYIKVDKKTDGLAAVEETPEVIAESPTVEKTEELETNQAEDDHTVSLSNHNNKQSFKKKLF